MSTHTPGPWSVDGWEIVKRDSNPGVILIADLDYAACGDDAAEAIANARLIAAAPDLLAACKRAKHYCECGCVEESPRTSPQLSDVLDAAIAKAEGGA